MPFTEIEHFANMIRLINVFILLAFACVQVRSQSGFARHFDDEWQGDNAAVIVNVFDDHVITSGYQKIYTENSFFYQYQRLFIDKNGELVLDDGDSDIREVVDVRKDGNLTYELLNSRRYSHPLIRVRDSRDSVILERVVAPENTYYDATLANKLYINGGSVYMLARGVNIAEYQEPGYEVAGVIYRMDHDLNMLNQRVYNWPTRFVDFRDIVGKEGNLTILYEQRKTNSSSYNTGIGRVNADWSIDTLYRSERSLFQRGFNSRTNLIQLPNGNLVFIDSNNESIGFSELDVLTCISPQGEIIWEYDYTVGNLFSSNRHKVDIRKVILSPAGKIIIAGKDFGRELFSGHRESSFLMQLDQDGNKEWFRVFNYLAGESEYWTQGDTIMPVETLFGDVKVDEDGSIYAAGFARVTLKRVGSNNSPRNNADAFIVRTDSVGCVLPDCEVEQFIGGTFKPVTTVVPGRRWTERTTTIEGMYIDTTYRFAPDSIYEEGRYYVPIERFDPVTSTYQRTGEAMREMWGKIFLRRDDFDYLVGERDLFVGDRLWSTFTFPGNVPVQKVEQEVVFRDTITTLDGIERIRLTYECTEEHGLPDYGTYEWIEGIGRLDGRLSVFQACIAPRNKEILCVFQGNQQLYQNPNYEDCGLILSAEETTSPSELKIIPNPTTGVIRIEGLETDAQVNLYSLNGQLLRSFKSEAVSLVEFRAGIYVLQVITEKGSYSTRVVKM
jgi:hypothetical protein